MANEFIIKNGLISQGNITVSGSITATGGVIVSGSIASASYASNAELLDGLDSTVFTLTGSFIAQTASFTAFTSSINSFSASILAQTASLNSFSSSVLTFTGSAATRLGALEAATSSLYSYTSSLNNKTSSFATTGSNTFIGTETISGSLVISGSGTPFTLNTDTLEITGSLIVTGSATFTGSVNFSSGLTGSLLGTSSYASNANLLDGLDSTVFTSTASFAAQTASFTAFTASILAQTASLNSFSASVLTFTGSASTRLGALEAYTSSLNNKTSSFATTGSNIFIGTQTITGSVLQSGSFTSTGTLTAQTLVVQTITSSVVYSSGSNIFGNSIGNTQIFTGSLSVTGSTAYFAGNVGIGTTSPNNIFTIYAASSAIYTQWIQSGTGTTSTDGLRIGLDASSNGIINLNEGTALITSVDGSERMRITNGGNVGIGTTNPAYLLDVNGTGRFSGKVIIGAGSSATAQLDVTSDASANGITLRNRTEDDYAFFNWRNNNGTELLAETYIQRTAANTATLRHTINNGSGVANYLTIASTGAATFSSSVTANIITSTSAGSTQIFLKSTGGGSNRDWQLQTGETAAGDLSIMQSTTVGGGTYATKFNLSPTGAATFSSSIASSIGGSGDNTFLLATGTGTGARSMYIANDGAAAIFGIEKAAGGAILGGSSAYASVLYSNNATPLQLGTNQLVRMTITSGGNVGIGTISPADKLVIQTTSGTNTGLALQRSANTDWLYYMLNPTGASSASNVYWRIGMQGSSNSFNIWTDNGTTNDSRLIITNGGNVGIGTTSPAYLLDVNGTGRFSLASTGSGAVLNIGNVGSGVFGGLAITDGGTYPMKIWGSELQFLTGNSTFGSATTRLTIASTGAATINAPTTDYAFTVNGTALWYTARFIGSSTTGQSYGPLITAGSNSSDQSFIVKDKAGSSNYFVVRGDGNVGIGTNTPNTYLQIVGNISTTTGLEDAQFLTITNSNATANNYSAIMFKDSDGNNSAGFGVQQISHITNEADIVLSPRLANGDITERMRIKGNGNVGIGTTSPSVRLQVVGANSAEGQLYVGNTDVTYSAGINFITSGTNRGFVGWRHTNSGSPFSLTGIHLFNTDNTNIVFGTNNTVKAVLNVDGNLGIGTTSPQYLLDSRGAGNFGDSRFYNSVQLTDGYAGTTQGWMWSGAAAKLYFGTGSVGAANTIMVLASGNVGIGTTSPGTKLHVVGGIGATGGSGYDTFGLGAWLGGDGTNGLLYMRNGGSWVPGYIDASVLYLNPQSGGNVGIGTTAPAAKLDVIGDIKVSAKLKVGSSQISTNSTTSAITTTKTIYARVGNGKSEFVFVMGDVGGAAYFADIVSFASGASVVVISSTTTYGSPSARTYSVSGDNLQLSMASGTAETQVFPISGS